MTDRARELLERAYYVLGELSYAILKDSGEYNLAGDIYEFLAEPTQDEAPVGTLDHNGNFKLLRMVGIPISQPMKLYEHPAPRPEFVRLSEEEVNSLTYAPYEPYELICAVENRLVEKNRG